MAALKRFEPGGLRLVGFQPLATLALEHRTGHSYLVYPAERLIGSSSAYAALLDAMLERKQMGRRQPNPMHRGARTEPWRVGSTDFPAVAGESGTL